MSDTSVSLVKCAIADITGAQWGETKKTVLPRLKIITGIEPWEADGAMWNDPRCQRTVYRLFAEAARRNAELATALEAADAVDRETITKLRLRAGQYAVRARALGAVVGEW